MHLIRTTLRTQPISSQTVNVVIVTDEPVEKKLPVCHGNRQACEKVTIVIVTYEPAEKKLSVCHGNRQACEKVPVCHSNRRAC
jgi:hypothetical protein